MNKMESRRKEEYNRHDPFEDFEWFIETDFDEDDWYEEDRNLNDDEILEFDETQGLYYEDQEGED